MFITRKLLMIKYWLKLLTMNNQCLLLKRIICLKQINRVEDMKINDKTKEHVTIVTLA